MGSQRRLLTRSLEPPLDNASLSVLARSYRCARGSLAPGLLYSVGPWTIDSGVAEWHTRNMTDHAGQDGGRADQSVTLEGPECCRIIGRVFGRPTDVEMGQEERLTVPGGLRVGGLHSASFNSEPRYAADPHFELDQLSTLTLRNAASLTASPLGPPRLLAVPTPAIYLSLSVQFRIYCSMGWASSVAWFTGVGHGIGDLWLHPLFSCLPPA